MMSYWLRISYWSSDVCSSNLVSLIGAFGIMYFFGFSINTLTLLAMVLAIGLVVDDAIVVLENIFRHIEEGKTRIEAAFLGAKRSEERSIGTECGSKCRCRSSPQ